MLLAGSTSFLFSFLLLDVYNVLGRDLIPIRPISGLAKGKRAAPAALDLKSSETFLWGDAGKFHGKALLSILNMLFPDDQNAKLANLTVYMPGNEENIISTEAFDGMLTSMECNQDNIAMTFEDDATFAYAQQVWDWVNGADNNSFVMVVGVGDCGSTKRTPFTVSSIAYDEAANKATLAATQSNWETIAHSYDLTVGSVSTQSQTPAFDRRDIDKTATVDFVHDFPFSFAIGANGLSASIACTNCSSTGSFDMEFKISQKFLVPTGASMKIKPKGVSAIAQIKLSGSGDVTDSLSKEFDIISIPVSGIKIPGILDLGPFLTVSVGAELSAISITAGIQSGATAKISDDAIMEVDLLNPDKNTFSGWEPEIDTVDVRVDASISGGVAVFLKPQLELKAEALGKQFTFLSTLAINRFLGKGFEIGLNMRVPNINAKLSAIACKSLNTLSSFPHSHQSSTSRSLCCSGEEDSCWRQCRY